LPHLKKALAGLLLVCGLGGLPSAAPATEIATGAMLGPRYKADLFYLRVGRDWKETYSGGEYRSKARGRLMILWLPNAVFEGEGLTEQTFDPDKNTDRVIAALDVYADYGVGATAMGAALGGGQVATLPGGARVSADVATNSLIVYAPASVQPLYEKLIRSLDQRRPQVMIEAEHEIVEAIELVHRTHRACEPRAPRGCGRPGGIRW